MKQSAKKAYQLITVLAILSFIISCKRTFDEPPSYLVPNVVANTTISDLKLQHTIVGDFNAVDTNNIIQGIITADDLTGSFYKQIVLQDATGAIVLLLNRSNLYLNYPVGRQIYVKCKGLTLSDDPYNGYITLGMVDMSDPTIPSSTGIPSSNIPQFIVQGSLANIVAPENVVPVQLGTSNMQDPFLGALIELNQFQFAAKDTSRTWADTIQKLYKTIPSTNCNAEVINLNTSPYCSFAGAVLPKGNGSIIGIYSVTPKSVNGTKRQLLLRDAKEVVMNDIRCTGAGSGYLFDASYVFAKIVTKTNINLPGWNNIAETGGVNYIGYTNTIGKYASITAYGATVNTVDVISWLVSPAIFIPANAINPTLIFNTVDGYDNGALFSLFISVNYNGNNTPSKLPNIWDVTNYKAPTGNTGFSSPISSGKIDLSIYSGKTIYLGFKYTGSKSANKTTTYEIDAPHIICN